MKRAKSAMISRTRSETKALLPGRLTFQSQVERARNTVNKTRRVFKESPKTWRINNTLEEQYLDDERGERIREKSLSSRFGLLQRPSAPGKQEGIEFPWSLRFLFKKIRSYPHLLQKESQNQSIGSMFWREKKMPKMMILTCGQDMIGRGSSEANSSRYP